MIEFVKNMFGLNHKKVSIQNLPSLGLFYKEDFKIIINKASSKDIKEYESNYEKDDIGLIIYYIKKIVSKNIILSNSYEFNDIKSIDIIFIFLEIVKFTKGKNINFIYINKETNLEDKIEFCSKYFNYFNIGNMIKYYDYEERCFIVDEYKYTLPSVGVENSLTNFLMNKSGSEIEFYSDLFYDFTHFVGDKNVLSFAEIENLIEIFNSDLDKIEMDKIKNIILMFSPLQRYSLIKDNKVVEMTSEIDLEKIWK